MEDHKRYIVLFLASIVPKRDRQGFNSLYVRHRAVYEDANSRLLQLDKEFGAQGHSVRTVVQCVQISAIIGRIANTIVEAARPLGREKPLAFVVSTHFAISHDALLEKIKDRVRDLCRYYETKFEDVRMPEVLLLAFEDIVPANVEESVLTPAQIEEHVRKIAEQTFSS